MLATVNEWEDTASNRQIITEKKLQRNKCWVELLRQCSRQGEKRCGVFISINGKEKRSQSDAWVNINYKKNRLRYFSFRHIFFTLYVPRLPMPLCLKNFLFAIFIFFFAFFFFTFLIYFSHVYFIALSVSLVF